MRTTRALIFAPTLGMVGLIGACVGASPEDYDAVASAMAPLLAEGPAGECEAVRECSGSTRGRVPDDFTYDDHGGMHGRRGEMEYDFRLECRGAGDQVQDRCDDSTSSADLDVYWYGTVHTGRHEANVERSAAWKLSALDTDLALLTGLGHFHVESTFHSMADGLEKSWVLDMEADYREVYVDTEDFGIHSGEIAYDIHAKRAYENDYRDIEREYDIFAVVRFDVSGGASLILDSDREYEVDLTTGRITHVR